MNVEEIALQILIALVNGPKVPDDDNDTANEAYVETAFDMADAFIAERDRRVSLKKQGLPAIARPKKIYQSNY